MSIRLNVGLSRKLGQPNYGSLGASCHVEVEVDAEAFRDRPEQVSHRIRETFQLCRMELERELSEQRTAGHVSDDFSHPPSAVIEGSHEAPQRGGRSPRPVTDAQLRAIHAIAAKAKIQLASQLNARFGVNNPAHLDVRQASELIELLKGRLETA